MDCKENDASNNSSIVACIGYRRNVFTEPLPNNDRGEDRQQGVLISLLLFLFPKYGKWAKYGFLLISL
jgi:hypothetical protein